MHAELDLNVRIDGQQLGERGPDDGLSCVDACCDADRACGLVAQLAEGGELRFDAVEMRTDGASSRYPASEGTTLRVVRVNRRSPSRSSSARIVWLSADGETPICAAARVKLRA